MAACRQKRRVRFITTAGLVNELVEAKHQLQLRRVLARWARYELIAMDEVGYVPMADVGAEFLFQVVAERAEKAAVIMTTNLPFSEWTQVIPNSRLCKALLDRVTDQAHIIETGEESYRFRRTLEKRRKKRTEHRPAAEGDFSLRLSLRPKRSALRAPQGFAPAGARGRNKTAKTAKYPRSTKKKGEKAKRKINNLGGAK